MRSFFENKRWTIFISILALGALVALAIGLRAIPFREAQPFGRGETRDVRIPPQNPVESLSNVSLLSQLMLWGTLFLLVILVSMLLSRELRKRLIIIFIRVALTFWALYYLTQSGVLNSILTFKTPTPASVTAVNNGSNAPPPVFIPPHVSPLWSYVISFGIALSLVALLWVLYRIWEKNSALRNNRQLNVIAKIARSSLRDLSMGRDSTDVIMNCYFNMSDVVAEKRRLRREIAMTPHEFSLRLEQAGLPGDAVRGLTHLFEGARYGDRKYGPKEINEAVTCLNSILYYCGETA